MLRFSDNFLFHPGCLEINQYARFPTKFYLYAESRCIFKENTFLVFNLRKVRYEDKEIKKKETNSRLNISHREK